MIGQNPLPFAQGHRKHALRHTAVLPCRRGNCRESKPRLYSFQGVHRDLLVQERKVFFRRQTSFQESLRVVQKLISPSRKPGWTDDHKVIPLLPHIAAQAVFWPTTPPGKQGFSPIPRDRFRLPLRSFSGEQKSPPRFASPCLDTIL